MGGEGGRGGGMLIEEVTNVHLNGDCERALSTPRRRRIPGQESRSFRQTGGGVDVGSLTPESEVNGVAGRCVEKDAKVVRWV